MAAVEEARREAVTSPCLVGTLGMFIIDQFRFEDEQTGADLGDRGLGTHIGGGGTYFAIGARMWLSPSKVLMIVDQGNDFSSAEKQKMDMYSGSRSDGTHSLWRYRERQDGHETTRAVNIYRGQERGFAYLTKKLRLDPKDLLCDKFEYFPIFIHCICSPERVLQICSQIDSLKEHWYRRDRPKIIWEPIPDSAIPENLEDCIRAFEHIDVLSPNHEEAASFLSVPKANVNTSHARDSIVRLLSGFYSKAAVIGLERLPVICIRSGALGTVISRCKGDAMWVDAYHFSDSKARIVDVTGAGNAWLGGFVAGLALANQQRDNQSDYQWTSKEVILAAQMGSVSASLVIEQQSLPLLTTNSEDKELWNGDNILRRLEILQGRSI